MVMEEKTETIIRALVEGFQLHLVAFQSIQVINYLVLLTEVMSFL